MKTQFQRAVDFTVSVLQTASDWQEGQTALAEHPEFGEFLRASGDEIDLAQRIIRAAENRLGDKIGY